jgi:cytochrome c oxidase subunit III
VADQLSVHRPYAEASQQREADLFGMYIFLVTEIMLFGGLLATAYVIRVMYAQEAVAAAKHLKLWLGGFNTAALLTSSLFVALAVVVARQGERHRTVLRLALAAGLGVLFLFIKCFEYLQEYREGLMPFPRPSSPLAQPGEHLFMNLYLVATSLHALHLALGIGLVLGLVWRIGRGSTPLPQRSITVEVVGLYWHLVDVVWVFIYPVFYLAR